MKISDPALDFAAATARARWRRNRRPDRFSTKVTVKDGQQTVNVKVTLAHKETFPLGGRTYNLSIREPDQPDGAPGDLLRKEPVHLSPDQILA